MLNQPPFTVLCVDDNADNRTSLAMLLRHEGYLVREAANGADALALVGQIDLVILDVLLPDFSGLEVCRRIKRDPATSLVAVILLSGHFTRTADKVEGLEGGGDVYLIKPAEPRELLGQVKALLRIRQTELALQQQARILDQIQDAVIATDLEGRVTGWNKGAERLFGYSAAEILGSLAAVLYPPGEGEPACRQIVTALRKGDRWEWERPMVRKSGEVRQVHSSFSLLYDGHSAPQGVVGYSVDVTERRLLEERVREAQRLEAVGRLAGGVAHDFNNLMTVVTGFADLLLSNMAEEDLQRGWVLEIKRAGERAAALTQQLLAFSRKQILQLQVVDLHALVRDLEPALRGLVGSGVALLVRADSQPGRVKVDPEQIRQVMFNLCGNAVQAMPNGGTLLVETRNVERGAQDAPTSAGVRPGPYVLLSVRDTGIGMTEEIKARIFEPFFTTRVEGNTGLGLASVHGIVQQSGGHIEVESAPGAGSTFKVYLPRLTE